MTRRLTREEAAAVLASAEPIPEVHAPGRTVPTTLRGADAQGRAATVRLEGATLVAFLSTSCDGCADLAELVRDGLDAVAVLGVLRAPDGGLPDAAVTAFVGARGRWLLGDEPFDALAVRAAPFFCLVDDGRVVVEGLAFGRAHVEDHVVRALAGAPRPDAVWLRPPPT